VTVLKPANPGLTVLVESMLKDAGIPYVIRGDQAFQNLYAFGQVEIQVREEDAEDAADLLGDL
tara:strand:+ start:1990 stop:2178 length:189 start_codon:yes stop_codon:yes gene_type:complete